MGRLAWSQVRFRPARTLALIAGASPGRALLAVPVAIAVAVAGGLAPAWRAARADPVSSVRPPVLALLPAALLCRLPAAHLLAEE